MTGARMLERITPLILTFNEAPNIARTLDALTWAREIVVIDSGSSDATLEILARYPNVRVLTRPFDTHAAQWNHGLRNAGIASEWVLALDADYVLGSDIVAEIARLDPRALVGGYRAAFNYVVLGRSVRGALYPPVTVLFRRDGAQFVQDGHTQRVTIDGHVAALTHKIAHDDRKPLSHWLMAQDRYMKLEAAAISARPWSHLSWGDRVRTVPLLAPSLVFLSCYVVRGGFLDGRAGAYYALQRLLAEALLGLRLIEARHAQRGQSR